MRRQRSSGDRYRPNVDVMVAIDGIPVKIKVSGRTYVLKAYKQRKGRWKTNRNQGGTAEG